MALHFLSQSSSAWLLAMTALRHSTHLPHRPPSHLLLDLPQQGAQMTEGPSSGALKSIPVTAPWPGFPPLLPANDGAGQGY